MSAQETKTFDFILHGYDSETEGVHYDYEKSIEDPSLIVSYTPLSNPDGFRIIIDSDNKTEQAEVLNVYAKARIYDKVTRETLREYTATINLTIQAHEPQPTQGLQPSTVAYTMSAQETKTFDFTLLGYDSETETVEYDYSADSSIESSLSHIGGDPLTNPDGYRVTLESDNQSGESIVGNVYAIADISDKISSETLRTYTATINLTIQAHEPTPTGGLQPTTVTETMKAQETKTFDFTLLGYDSETETVEYEYSVDSEIELSISDISGQPLTNPDGYRVSIETNNETEQALVGDVYVTALIRDKDTWEVLREYTATINLTIEGLNPEP